VIKKLKFDHQTQYNPRTQAVHTFSAGWSCPWPHL